MVMKLIKYLEKEKKMEINEFRNWLRESNFKVIGEYPTYVSYSRGFRYVDLYDNGAITVTFCSMVEYTSYETNVGCFEKQKDGSLKVSIWVINENGDEVEEVHYLYQH